MWLWDEWPERWGADAGIDLVAEEESGLLWAIQAKAYDPAYSVTKADVDTFLSESARHEFAFRLLIATTVRIGKTADRTIQAQEKPASRLLLVDLRAAQVSWPRSPADLRPTQPRPSALDNAVAVWATTPLTIVHADRGSQFRSHAFVRALRRREVRGSRAESPPADNAAMESFCALLQKNVLNLKRWDTREEFRLAFVT